MSEKLLSGSFEEIELIERHIRMLEATKEHQPVGIIRLSEITGIAKHKVRYSLRLLERDGIIAATPDGATVTDRYDEYIREVCEKLDELRGKIDDLRAKL